MSADEGEEDGVDGRTLYLYDGETADCEFEVGVLKVLVAEGSPEVLIEVILICELEGRSLVAVPQGGWHRRAANRSLPPGSLSKPVAVEVAGAARDDRPTLLVGQRLKIWLGFLRASLVEALVFEHDGEVDVAFATVGGESGFVPHAEALMEVAKDKFQFATATEGEAPPAPAAQPQVAEAAVEARLAKLEQSIATMASSMQALTLERVEKTKPPPPARAPQAVESLPGLDPGVVKSALTAGIDMESLKQFSQLLAGNPARRLKDPGGRNGPEEGGLGRVGERGPARRPGGGCARGRAARRSSPRSYERRLGEVDHPCGGPADPKDEAWLPFGAGLGRRSRRVWCSRRWRDLQQKELLSSSCPEAGSSREPRGDLYYDREVDAGGPSLSHAGPRDAEADFVCSGVAGKQEPAHQLPGGCENSLGGGRHTGLPQGQSSCCAHVAPSRPGCSRQGLLDAGGRGQPRACSAVPLLRQPRCGGCIGPASFEAVRTTVGRDNAPSSQGHGGLCGAEAEAWCKDEPVPPDRGSGRPAGPEGGGQAKAKTLGPRAGPCMMPGPGPASSGATQGRLKVPGANAPVISVPGLANSMTRRVLSSRCDFASFLSDVTCLPGTSTSASPSVWPVPLPFPEVCRGHCSGATAWRKRYVNLAVAAMNWLFLSRPRCTPAGLAAGNPLSKRQWEMVKLLERCLDGCDFLTFEPPSQRGPSLPCRGRISG